MVKKLYTLKLDQLVDIVEHIYILNVLGVVEEYTRTEAHHSKLVEVGIQLELAYD